MTSELVMLERLAVLLLSTMLFSVFVWWCFLFGAISPLRRTWIQVHPPHPTYSTACLLPCAQSDYSCPEMSQPHASGSEYTLSLTRDPDNADRHTLLTCTTPVQSCVVFIFSLAVIYPITGGSHNRCSLMFYSSITVGVHLYIFPLSWFIYWVSVCSHGFLCA